MRVFLCQALTGPKEPLVFPIGLAYVASMLGDHDLLCWDPNVSPNSCLDEFCDRIKKFEPEVVGISLRNIDNPIARVARGSYYPLFASMVRRAKDTLPSCKLVIGGAGFSVFAEHIMRLNPEIDFGVFSEGEKTFPDLLNNLEHPERAKNLFVRHDESIVFTGREDYVDFASLPLPSRELFDISKYKGRSSIGIQTKRGCRFECIYCSHQYYMGTRYRMRPPKDVVDEIETLVNEYSIESFYFTDPVFNFPPEHGREICREIIRRKVDVTWEAPFRPDYLNRNYMLEAVKAGCRLFDFSPDGASNNAMRILGKNLDVGSIDKSIKWANEIQGAKVAYEFLYDIPEFNSEHIRGLLHFVPQILSRCREKLSYLNLSKMRIYPHTSLYNIALKEEKISEKTDLLFPAYYESKSFQKIRNLLPFMFRFSCLPTHISGTLRSRYSSRDDSDDH